MSRSLTVSLPPMVRVVQVIVALVVAVGLVYLGLRIGSALTAPAPAEGLSGGAALQEVHTTQGVYLGKVAAEDGSYLRLASPAVVREEQAQGGGQSGRVLVILLAAEPYYVSGDILIPTSQVVLVGNVIPGSPLDTAYRQARGELPPPAATPAPSLSSNVP